MGQLKEKLGELISKAQSEKAAAVLILNHAREQISKARKSKTLAMEAIFSDSGLGGHKHIQSENGSILELHADGTKVQRKANGRGAIVVVGGVQLSLPGSIIRNRVQETILVEEEHPEPVVVLVPGNGQGKEQVQLFPAVDVWVEPKSKTQVQFKQNGDILCVRGHARVHIDQLPTAKEHDQERSIIYYLPTNQTKQLENQLGSGEAESNIFPEFSVVLLPHQGILVNVPESCGAQLGTNGDGEGGSSCWSPRKVHFDAQGSMTVLAGHANHILTLFA
jgi:hypothetical protein